MSDHNLSFICKSENCSDSDDKQWPECKSQGNAPAICPNKTILPLWLAEREQELAALQAKVDYAHEFGLVIGILKSSDCPDGKLAGDTRPGSELQRLERSIADLIVAEQKVGELRKELKQKCIHVVEVATYNGKLSEENERLKKDLDDWTEREAAICPEDFGFEEVIKKLREKNEKEKYAVKTLAESTSALLHRAEDAEAKLSAAYKLLEAVRDNVIKLREENEANIQKWRDYENEYILPVFKWAKEMGIDLRALVREAAGNSTVRFFEKLREENERLKSKIQHCDNCGGDWVDNGLQAKCYCAYLKTARDALKHIEAEHKSLRRELTTIFGKPQRGETWTEGMLILIGEERAKLADREHEIKKLREEEYRNTPSEGPGSFNE